MASPSMTYNAIGNIRASSASNLTAGSNLTNDLDFSGNFEGQVQLSATGVTAVAGTCGVQIDVLAGTGASITYDTQASFTMVLAQNAMVVGTAKLVTVKVPTGKYRFKFTNLDVTNAVTISVTSATIDSVA